MRAANLTILGAILAMGPLSGCDFLKRNGGSQVTPVPGVPIEDRQANQFVAYLNQQAGPLTSVRYDDVSLSASDAGGNMPRLTEGTLACAQPRYFRLMSGHWATSGSEVDVGSNTNEFWMYVKRPEQTYVYCSHDDFTRGKAQLPVPFEPDWVLEALGMSTYDPNLTYQIDADQKNRVYTLSFDTRTPQGEPIRKVVVFAGDRAAGDRPQVLKHAVLDANRKVIAAAEVKEVKTIASGTGAVQVPTHVVLEWPQQKFKMDLTLGRPRLNETMTAQEQAFFFVRPEIRGATPINLATSPFRPSSVRSSTPDGSRPRLFGNN